MFNEPLDFAELDKLTKKTFAEETMKKINWVTSMYNEWRENRNASPEFEYIEADLDYTDPLTIDNLSYALCHFMTEIHKLDGTEFPGKTMCEIVDDENFRVIKVYSGQCYE